METETDNLEIRIAKLIKKKHLTRYRLSTQLNISQKTLYMYMKGKNPIPSDVLTQMCVIFGCSADYILGNPFVFVIKDKENGEVIAAFDCGGNEVIERNDVVVKRYMQPSSATLT